MRRDCFSAEKRKKYVTASLGKPGKYRGGNTHTGSPHSGYDPFAAQKGQPCILCGMPECIGLPEGGKGEDKQMKKWLFILLAIMLCLINSGCDMEVAFPEAGSEPGVTEEVTAWQETATKEDAAAVKKDGIYTSPREVAAYLHLYNKLPENYITKAEASRLGWNSKKGNLDEIVPGKSIGGDFFGNYEGILPKKKYRECDVNYTGGYRGAERLIYSEDGDIYYTNDHYKSFEPLYIGGKEK